MDVILISGAFLSFFLGLMLLSRKKRNVPHLIHIVWLMYNTLVFACYYLYDYVRIIPLESLLLPMPLFEITFLYLHVKYTINGENRFDLPDIFFFILPVSCFMFLFFLDTDMSTFQSTYVGIYNGDSGTLLFFCLYVVCVLSSVFLSFRLERKASTAGFLDKMRCFSYRRIYYYLLLYLAIFSFYALAMLKIMIPWIDMDVVVFGSMLAMTLMFGLISIKKTGYFYENKEDGIIEASTVHDDNAIKHGDDGNYDSDCASCETSSLAFDTPDSSAIANLNMPMEDAEYIYHNLLEIMEKDKLYLNPQLKLSDLAKKMRLPNSYISKIINFYEKKNFYDFVGQYRVDEFLRLVSSSDNDKYNIYSLAYDSGFSSKSTFYSVFRRLKGMSPSDYIKKES